MKQRPYHKLPGKRFFLFARRSLWQGPDHLLWVENNLMQEQYKRFYFKDIQAVILCRNQHRLFWTILWGTLLLLFGACGLAFSGSDVAFFILSAVWALLLVINLLAGPSCDVYLQTAVQREQLTSLVRVRTAVKVLDRIKELAEQAQGALDGRLLDGSGTVSRVADGGRASISDAAVREPERMADAAEPHAQGLHMILIGLLLSLGFLDLAQLYLKWIWLAALDILGLAGLLVLAIVVVVRRRRYGKSSLLTVVGWLALILAVLRGLTAYGFFITTSLQHPGMAYNAGMIMKRFLELLMADHPVVTGLAVGFASAGLILGLLGAVALRMQRQNSMEISSA
jgi:hypothetical protein